MEIYDLCRFTLSYMFQILMDLGMGQNPGTPGEPQNSWDLWMFIPLKMILIGIDPYPHCLT